MKRIDSHIHLILNESEIPLLETLDMKALCICVAGMNNDWRAKNAEPYRRQAERHPDRFAWCTSFTLPADGVGGPKWADGVIQQLEADFAAGAVGCKVWKNVGMELKDPAGRMILVDDPIFEPVFRWLEQNDKPTIMHIAEPKACWLPLTDPDDPHYGYYSKATKWHMYGKPDVHSHEALMDSRDRVLARHPKLRVIGAHYGSMEYDVDAVAQRFEKYPNFAVDTSGRLGDTVRQTSQNREKVRDFFLKYQDRILWGTDMILERREEVSEEKQAAGAAMLKRHWETEWTYFATDEQLTLHNKTCTGLALPDKTLARLFNENVRAWYPGV